jgi:tRNA(Ile)-lysidine synthase
MDLLVSVRDFARQHALVRPDGATRVVAAVSGGSDSVAMLHLLRALDARGELQIAGIAHFNHQLRPAADAEERFVVGIAETLRLPVFCDRADVRAIARSQRRSLEDAARTARHEFFARARVQFGADCVALGHTRDDQAETVLLRATRGAGLRGLAGMRPRAGDVIRPLLGCRRAALREWLDARQIAFVEDESNADVSIPRNRVRAELMPLLESRFNPGVVGVLADQAALVAEALEWMTSAGEELARAAAIDTDGVAGTRVFDIATLQQAPPALRRLALWEAMRTISGGRTISFGHVEAALRLMQTGGTIDVPGHRVQRDGVRLVLTGRPERTKGRWANAENLENPANPSNLSNRSNLFRYPLSIPGETALPEADCVVSAEIVARATVSNVLARRDVAMVRSDLCQGSLSVRNRRAGDRFSPLGLGGKKKLQDFFVDRKVASARRDSVPLVVDESDRIVWVAGYGIDEAFRVTDPAQAVLILKLKALGGSA